MKKYFFTFFIVLLVLGCWSHSQAQDTTAPMVTITGVPTTAKNAAFNVTVQFSEPVTGFVQEELSVAGTSNSTITNWVPLPDGSIYVARIMPAADGTAIFNIAANVAQDSENNGNTAATQKTVTVNLTTPDTVKPSVSIIVPSGVQTGPFSVTICFNESVTGFTNLDLSVSGAGASVISLSGSGTIYTATITFTQSGIVTLNLPANVAHDDANNPNTAAVQETITVVLLEAAAAPAHQARTLQEEIQRLKALQNPDLADLIQALEARLAALTPDTTALLPNYPNPFNPETWIPYRLAEDAFVALTIYDLNGQVVRALDVGHQIAAVYENRSTAIYWDGRNGSGEPVASGVYFYTLTAGDYSATRKMMILK